MRLILSGQRNKAGGEHNTVFLHKLMLAITLVIRIFAVAAAAATAAVCVCVCVQDVSGFNNSYESLIQF